MERTRSGPELKVKIAAGYFAVAGFVVGYLVNETMNDRPEPYAEIELRDTVENGAVAAQNANDILCAQLHDEYRERHGLQDREENSVVTGTSIPQKSPTIEPSQDVVTPNKGSIVTIPPFQHEAC